MWFKFFIFYYNCHLSTDLSMHIPAFVFVCLRENVLACKRPSACACACACACANARARMCVRTCAVRFVRARVRVRVCAHVYTRVRVCLRARDVLLRVCACVRVRVRAAGGRAGGGRRPLLRGDIYYSIDIIIIYYIHI